MATLDEMNNFYRLKTKYEESYNIDKKRIINNPQLSWKEKRKEFKKLKSKCVNCKRKGGTEFKIFYNKDPNSDSSSTKRIAKAFCNADGPNRCNLNIEIDFDNKSNLNTELQAAEEDIKRLRNTIIIDKNDSLFGYISIPTALEKFDKIKEELEEATILYEMQLNHIFTFIETKEKKAEIKQLKLDIYSSIQKIKTYIEKYNQDKNNTFITDLVTLYQVELMPNLKDLHKFMYSYMGTDYTCIDNKCHLTQLEYTIQDFEADYILLNKS